ncbi:putative toxin-antitoxin system toxin component, PIN family [Bacillus licheniformis]|uniref:putative toxin-antitoxin system toxin component, PIN family n=1 Tax=Bacillus licheniformis TaxID=1402 RepID=UPI000C78D64B|nr:putative toxin-antitoxin system toxin component, PIN family [Bacillus licheniformis]PLS10612.1 putative toxin-antitoxin system toxin component, PIN family [Bacillus licheniformis]
MKAVVDTSTIMRAWLKKFNEPKHILKKIENGDFELLMTEEMAVELQVAFTHAVLRALNSPKQKTKFDPVPYFNDIATFIYGSTRIETHTEITSCSDPEDAMFFECAIDGNAEYCISSDRSIYEFKNYSKNVMELALVKDIKIFNPQQYVEHEKELLNPKPQIKTTGA